MTSVIKYYEGIDSVAVIGNYLPRQCGIATFTTDLVEGLSAEAPDIKCWAAAMNDKPEGYPYPKKVRFEINQNKLADYTDTFLWPPSMCQNWPPSMCQNAHFLGK